MIQDTLFFGREINRDEFERKLRENPANDHLIKNTTEEIKEVTEDNSLEQRLYKFVNEYDIYDTDDEKNPREEVSIDQIKDDLKDSKSIENTFNYFKEIYESEDGDLKDDFESRLYEFIVELEKLQKEKLTEEQRKEQIVEIPTEEKQNEIITPKIKRVITNNNIANYNLHPEIPIEERNQYVITNNNLGEGSPREKFARNIEAIKILKKCENENRYATPEEQEKLAQYVGWGGLSKAFDNSDTSWSREYFILKDLLTEEEYAKARESSLTAFYTPPIVIKSIYNALENMGLKDANILEPSCRNWQFFRNVTSRTK